MATVGVIGANTVHSSIRTRTMRQEIAYRPILYDTIRYDTIDETEQLMVWLA